MTVYLNRERMRVIEKNERGVVVYRKKYRFGDEIDTDHLTEGREDALLESGVFVESKDDLRTRRGGLVPYRGSEVTGAGTGEGSERTEYDAPPEEQPEAQNDGEDVEPADEYSGMDYNELQDAAKAADPPIPANQSADALREALREQG